MSAAKSAVVTGAGRGLGRAIATMLAARGYSVLVTDVDGSAAGAVAAELGPPARAQALDVRDHEQAEAARDAVLARTGRLDVWVNNAGVLLTGPAWEQDERTRRLMVEVNAIGTMNGTLAALEPMRAQRSGHVVNIVSLAGLVAAPGETVYSASKHAALAFSLGTAMDLRLAGVRDVHISCVCPDGIWTPMLHDKLDDPAAALSFSGRLMLPEEVVVAIGKVLDRPRQVTAVPRWRGLEARAFDAVPNLALRVGPVMLKTALRSQRKIRERLAGSGVTVPAGPPPDAR